MFAESDNHSHDLKKIREEKGLSLEELFKRTRIRVTYLQAIENREFHLLPVPVYSKNFIRIYARALGIDAEPILKEYENYVDSQQKKIIPQEDNEDKRKSLVKLAGKKTYLIIAVVLFIVVVAQWLISKQNESSSDSVGPAKVDRSRINTEKKIDASISLGEQAEADTLAELEGKFNPSLAKEGKPRVPDSTTTSVAVKNNLLPVTDVSNPIQKEANLLVITATEDTWLRIKADQQSPLKVFLKAGEKFEQRAAVFDIDIGNAGGIRIKFKGKNIENLGKTGEVVHLRLP